MGCDIHLYCEYRKDKNSKWQSADYFKLIEYEVEERPFYDDKIIEKFDMVPLYDGRNYPLFSVLADVRNDSGITPITTPKGFPNDISDYVRREYQIWEMDGHSRSYLHRSEIVNYLTSKHPCEIKDIRVQEEGRYSLNQLLSLIEKRMCEVFYISDYIPTRMITDLDKVDDNFRIVFWFDN